MKENDCMKTKIYEANICCTNKWFCIYEMRPGTGIRRELIVSYRFLAIGNAIWTYFWTPMLTKLKGKRCSGGSLPVLHFNLEIKKNIGMRLRNSNFFTNVTILHTRHLWFKNSKKKNNQRNKNIQEALLGPGVGEDTCHTLFIYFLFYKYIILKMFWML